jgi:hypothetical protein
VIATGGVKGSAMIAAGSSRLKRPANCRFGVVAAAIAAAAPLVCASCTEEFPVEIPRTANATTATGGSASSQRSVVPIVTEETGLPLKTRDGLLSGDAFGASTKFSSGYYQQIIGEQLERYPRALLERIGLKRVILCKNLAFDEAHCVAFADVERGQLFLSVESLADPATLRRTVHHELFHQIDFADDGVLAEDVQWQVLNAPGFQYVGDPRQLASDPSAMTVNDAVAGFLNRYSATSATEDKAELYSYLVTDPEIVRRRAGRDDILRRKADRLRKMIDTFGPYSRGLLGRG